MRSHCCNWLTAALLNACLLLWGVGCATDNSASGVTGLTQGGDTTDGGGTLDGYVGGDAGVIPSDTTGDLGSGWPPYDSGGESDVLGVDGGVIGVDAGPPAGSCFNRCGQYDKSAACQCDKQCTKAGDCCPDYQILCTTTTGPVCGNGACESGESMMNCPQDCYSKVVCGNGACEAGETPMNCAVDCGGQQAACGNGACEPGENAYNCPSDCKTLPTCGNGQCDSGEDVNTSPADCMQISPGQLLKCFQKACPGEYASCESYPECAGVLKCSMACNDLNCMDGCAKGVSAVTLQKFLNPLGQCGGNAGCIPVQPPTPVCGNGSCETGETTKSCPQDCGGGIDPGAIAACVAGACPDQWNKCGQTPACANVLACAKQCQDNACLQKCATMADPSTLQTLVLPLLQCGQNNNCFSGTTTPTCGNGVCDSSETYQTCPQDCPAPINSVEACIAKACPADWQTCSSNPTCYSAAQCMEAGGSLLQCVKDFNTGQILYSVIQCAQNNKCLNGGGTSTNSCQGLCGKTLPGSTCQCDATCKKLNNCCSDYDALCAAPPPSYCGDGVCSAKSGETPQNCPMDCGTPPQQTCTTIADCPAGQICCQQPSGKVCVGQGQCK